MNNIPRQEQLFIGGNFNATVGRPIDCERQTIGRFTIGNRNSNGDLLMSFAALNDLTISNTTFQKKPHRLHTWRSNDGKPRDQIDYVIVRRR